MQYTPQPLKELCVKVIVSCHNIGNKNIQVTKKLFLSTYTTHHIRSNMPKNRHQPFIIQYISFV